MLRAFVQFALVAACLAFLAGGASLRAQDDPKLAKKLAKLEAKLAKSELKVEAAQLKQDDLAAQELLAQAALADAQALPEGTPEELKAKAKAVKLAEKLAAKLAKKLAKAQGKTVKAEQKVQDVMAAIELLVPGYFDDTTTGDGGDDGGDDGSGGIDDGGGDDGGGDDGGGGIDDGGGGDDGGGDPGGGDPGGGDPGGGDPGGGDPGGGDPGGGDPGGGDPDPDPGLDPALAQPLLAVDCGDLNGYPAPEAGWTLLTETTGPAGVTLAPAAQDTVHVAQSITYGGNDYVFYPSSVVALDPDQVGERRKLTALQLADPTTLSIGGLPPSTAVRVLLELGATAPWVEFINGNWTGVDSATRGLRVAVDGPAAGDQFTTVAQDLRCGTGIIANTFATNIGSILPLWVLGTTDAAGKLRLRLSSDSPRPVLLAAFSVYRHEALPIVYRRTAAGPLQSEAPAAAAFVAAFNAGDLDGAQALALALADPLLRGVALAHVAGWLGGERDDRTALLAPARQALLLAQAQGHAAASVLLEQIGHVQRALDHLDARGYSHAQECASEGGPGFLNPDCATQIYSKLGQADSNVNVHIALRELRALAAGALGPNALWDLAAWNAGVLAAGAYEPSPLAFLAVKQTGVALTAMNPLLGVTAADPESVELLEAARDVFDGFRDLGFAAQDFPRDRELPLFAAYVDAGSHPKGWSESALALFDTAELQDSWWGPDLLAPADVAEAPAWANAQRRLLRAYRLFVAEWFERHLDHDELGGGQGDDIELLLQLFPLLAARRDGSERLLASRLDDLVHYGLEESGTVQDGYWAGALTDVEHSSEYGADPYLVSSAVFGETARTALLAGLNARHVLQPLQAGTAFAGVSNAGRTHFRSWYFTNAGPASDGSHALDVFLNGRALVPALGLAQRGSLGSGHPAVIDLRAWAAGWRDDALLATGGKPAGFPAPAQWPSNALGVNGLWYTQQGVAGDDSQWTTGEVAYVLGLLHTAYRQSDAADRWQFLLPAVRMFRAVKNWEDAGKPSGAAGSAAWAAARFKSGGLFGRLVLAHQPELAADATLNGQLDPAGGGSTYVDAALLERLRTWLVTDFTNQGPVLRYALQDVGTCAPHQVKDPSLVTALYADAVDYFRTAWPLLVRHALHTDRVFANPSGVQRELLTAWCGATIVEGLPFLPLVRWSGDGLDLAVLMNHRDEAGTQWSAFVHNFAPAPATVTLVLERGLQPGTYLLEAGPAIASCDAFPGGVTTSTPLTKRGLTTSTSLSLPPGLSLVRLTRTGSATAASKWDLVLDPPRLQPGVAGSATVTVRVANAGVAAAPASSLDLYVAAVDPTGALAAPATLPAELLLGSATVSLGAATGFVLPQQTASFSLPAGSPLLALLASGYGLQFRAQLATGAPGAAEWDPVNNTQSRCWFLTDLVPDP